MPFIVILLLLAAAIGGGTSVAARHSLPGEPLWGFKTGVNERIGSALAPEGNAQASFDIAAIEERIREAAALAAGSKLSAELKAKIESNVETHAKSVVAEITTIGSAGGYAIASDIAARYQSALSKTVSGGLEIRAALDEASRLFADLDQKTNQQ